MSSRKTQIANGIEKDINFLLENPLKLKKFKNYIEMIKMKSRQRKESLLTQDHIKKNIEITRVWKYRYQNKMMQAFGITLQVRPKTFIRQTQVTLQFYKFRRSFQENLAREKKIIENKRWEVYKEVREKERQAELKIKLTKARAKHYFTLYTMLNAFKMGTEKLKNRKQKVLRNLRELFATKKIKLYQRRRMLKNGANLDIRVKQTLKQGLAFLQNVNIENNSLKAENIMVDFIRNIALRKFIKEKCINFILQVKVIQLFYKSRIKRKKQEEMLKIWKDHGVTTKSKSSKVKSKRNKLKKSASRQSNAFKAKTQAKSEVALAVATETANPESFFVTANNE